MTQILKSRNEIFYNQSRTTLSATNTAIKKIAKTGTGLGEVLKKVVSNLKWLSRYVVDSVLVIISKFLRMEKVVWDSSQEVVELNEQVKWLPGCREPYPLMEELISWMAEGARKETIVDEDLFCDKQILQSIVKSKEFFDHLEDREMHKARTKSNPFENIQRAFFQNRAAMKMANIDAVFDFMFTNPKYKDGKCLVGEDSLLYFADVCGGPGGFTEYVLWRKKWRAKGFGFTLKGKNDFKLDNFYGGAPDSFEAHYGAGGRDGDGDVLKEANIKAFVKFVLESTSGKGVHFVMSDGGFSVKGQENLQEILSKQLYVCQFLVALCIVRNEGHFVCKLFDVFTPFSVGLVYLMYCAFDSVCLHKPNTSRPASSERFIICKGKRQQFQAIRDYLFKVNARLNQLGSSQIGVTTSKIDVTEIVPLSMLLADKEFCNYMRQSNDTIGKRQIVYLLKIRAFHQNPNLSETRQRQIKVDCLKNWKIPAQVRRGPSFEDPRNQCFPIFDLKFVSLGSLLPENCTYILGLGQKKNYLFNKLLCLWIPVPQNCNFDLPALTLICAEFVQESRDEGKKLKKWNSLHIIDAIYVSSENWQRKYDLKERNRMLRLFVTAMHKPSVPNQMTLRVKSLHSLQSLQDHLKDVFQKALCLKHMISISTCFNIH